MKPLIKPIRHVYNWPNITIGNTLDALLHAYKTKSMFIPDGRFDYLYGDKFNQKLSVSPILNWEPGSPLIKACEHFSRIIGFSGRMPINPDEIIIEPEENLLILFFLSKTIKVHYENLRIFSTNLLSGIPFDIEREIGSYLVEDVFEFKSTSARFKSFPELQDESSNFAFKVWAHKEKFIQQKRIIARSIISVENIENTDYSQQIVALKIADMASTIGYNLPLEFSERLKKLDQRLIYHKQDNIEIGVHENICY